MSALTISSSSRFLAGKVDVGGSKSISNRALIVNALSGGKIEIEGLSHATDTRELAEALTTTDTTINAGLGGTSARFLLALLAAREGEWILTAEERMRQRPIGPLVEALTSIGALIEFTDEEGKLPVRIQGGKIKGGTVKLMGNESSQFISALLMIGPLMPEGLTVVVPPKQVSMPYIRMTTKMMTRFGGDVLDEGERISIGAGGYREGKARVDKDWSSAAFFFGLAALCDEAELSIEELSLKTTQGDVAIADLIRPFGVQSAPTIHGVHITRKGARAEEVSFDLSDSPDLCPVLAVVAAAHGMPATFRGVEHLAHKESNRLEVLGSELQKGGVSFLEENGEYHLSGKWSGAASIDPHGDHRIAMAFSLLGVLQPITIEDPDCVAKSFPGWWDELKKVGMTIDTGSVR